MAYTRRKVRPATSIPIDPDKLRMVLRRRFLTHVAISELMELDRNWMSVMLSKRRMNLYRLDELAQNLCMTLDELFNEIVDEEEWTRL